MLIAVMSGCAATETSRSAGETVDDATLTTTVKAELVQEQSLEAFQIDVDTYRGVVQLNGFVDTAENAEKAAKIANEVPGVVSVKNNLQIKPVPAG
jgi:osmotically-inducible protein OsmY